MKNGLRFVLPSLKYAKGYQILINDGAKEENVIERTKRISLRESKKEIKEKITAIRAGNLVEIFAVLNNTVVGHAFARRLDNPFLKAWCKRWI
ncbi:MAG: hypothetical protein QXI58_08200 [Candidatus Micrarchaeia archaeon]